MNDVLVDELIKILEEDYKCRVTKGEASDIGRSLVAWFDLALKISRKNHREALSQSRTLSDSAAR